MTGIFLDQKEVRKKLKDHYAEDKEILNVNFFRTSF
jgi:23S rRNA (cytosine1962-C5)-methyltransferase